MRIFGAASSPSSSSLLFWEVGSRSETLFGFAFPWVGQVPAPSAVLKEIYRLIQEPSFWQSAYLSTLRVLEGFFAAMLVGIPLGLAMAVSRTFYGITFPVFEVLRPIPPLAWVPAAIIFWPTQELSIAFVTFLGAFFTIVINVIGGAQSIDVRYFQAARSMGSSTFDIFRRIILPGVLPSIVVGATVGIGITWAVVVAAEMISGGGSAGSMGGARWRIRLLYLELLCRRLLHPDRCRHDQYWRGRLHVERHPAQSRAMDDSLARGRLRIGNDATSSQVVSVSSPFHGSTALGSQIVVNNVSKSYGAEAFAKQVVHNCSFTIERGKLTVMIGPSGCGKSTLIRLVAGFERPSSGTITVDDKPVNGPGVDRLVVFQESALFPWMTTYDNIMYGPRARHEDTKEMRDFAEALLQKVGLAAFREKYPAAALWRHAASRRVGALDDQPTQRHDT